MWVERRSQFSVAAALVHKAIGDKLTCLFVDNGLLRQDEAREVVETFGRNMQMNLVAVDASKQFLTPWRELPTPKRSASVSAIPSFGSLKKKRRN